MSLEYRVLEYTQDAGYVTMLEQESTFTDVTKAARRFESAKKLVDDKHLFAVEFHVGEVKVETIGMEGYYGTK